MKPDTLKELLAGNFICQFAFPEAYEDLTAAGDSERVDAWLAGIDRRLARLGEDGAFYVAPLQVHRNEDVSKVRADLIRFRDSYGLLTQMLNLVRLAKEGFRGVPGEYVQLAEIVLRVNEDSTLVAQLRELRIPGADSRWSNHDLMRRMLEKLKADGYLVLSNEASEIYQIAGKIDHLHAVLQYLVENVPELSEAPLEELGVGEEGQNKAIEQSDLLRNLGQDDERE
ncbi:hypothetical protein [Hydrogenophaga sp. PAMC20947]|uniref:hypothetical protein n=1 Tax=Hydrogenophaga sp. PAMC20947 TaxID=2565558 RepID=UPI00109E25D9|nr:hypothetical protein [Hydrogenophaga sp. PAMC20947]QCB46944.1 hypothetical protein E5678_13485 [Hydrogenophaga sp. PAMC20947]